MSDDEFPGLLFTLSNPTASVTVTAASAPAAPDLAARLAGVEDLVRFADPTRVAEVAADLRARAEAAGDRPATAAAMLFQAEAALRLGNQATAVDLVSRSRALDVDLSAELMVRGWFLLAVVFTDLDDHPRALERVMDAVTSFDDSVSRRLRARVLVAGAQTLNHLGDRRGCLEWFDRAQVLAQGDDYTEETVANNRAYFSLMAGDADDAQAQAQVLQALIQRQDRPPDTHVLDTLARIHLQSNDLTAALSIARQAVRAAQRPDVHSADALPETLMTLAAVQRRSGMTQESCSTLEWADSVCGPEHALMRRLLLREQAETRAAMGDYREAFALHKEFHAAEKAAFTAQEEDRARYRQAVYESMTAQREAARYREQARRDALTGLYNRRYMEERLTALLADQTASASTALNIVLLDLDHFKSVNDTYSHAAGDDVLRAVAHLLQTAAAHGAAGSFGARLGGEELVLVLRTPDPTQAHAITEELRGDVEHHDWQPITPGRVVTISGGMATARPGDTSSTLLARADSHLYEAKNSGRNRITAGR